MADFRSSAAELLVPSPGAPFLPAEARPQSIPCTLVVPVYNERECVLALTDTLVELDAEYGEKFTFDFLLVDDGSTDGTAELLEEAFQERPNFEVLRHPHNRGIAAAIHTGLRHAESEVVVSIDADGSYDVRLIQEMVALLGPEVDMVTASPYHPEGFVENVSWWRLWLSRRASGMYRIVLRQKLYCYTSCFRVYRRSKILGLEPNNAGFVGVAELLWRADRQGLKIVECPAILRTRVAGQSKMRVFRAAIRHMRLVFSIGCDRLHKRWSGQQA